MPFFIHYFLVLRIWPTSLLRWYVSRFSLSARREESLDDGLVETSGTERFGRPAWARIFAAAAHCLHGRRASKSISYIALTCEI